MDPHLDEAPEAPPATPRRPPRPGSVAKALLTGAVIEIVGTLVVGVVAALVYGMVLASQGLSREEVNQALAHMEPLSVVGLLSGAAGSFVSVFAGYACAALARRRRPRRVQRRQCGDPEPAHRGRRHVRRMAVHQGPAGALSGACCPGHNGRLACAAVSPSRDRGARARSVAACRAGAACGT
jgi:hypothetical protein